MRLPEDIVLVLAGGNALGAYQAGAYEALHERAIEPRWVSGASIGAINGAIIAGNAAPDRVARLRDFWRLAEQFGSADPSEKKAGTRSSRLGRTLAANQTFMTGRPGIFAPRLFGLWSALPGMPDDVSLFNTAPLLRTLHHCIDFDRLNDGPVRLTAAAVDVETGEDVFFDTARTRVEAEHLRASAAFPVIYPPVEIDGRVLVDPAVSANLPVLPLFSEYPDRDSLYMAIDLVARGGARPRSVGDALKRAQDLVFANQARHSIQALGTEMKLRQAERALAARAATAPSGTSASSIGYGDTPQPSVTLLQVMYSESGAESAAKMFDYSQASIQERWAAGYRDMHMCLKQFESLDSPGGPDFSSLQFEQGTITASS